MLYMRFPGVPISMDHAYESVVRRQKGKGKHRGTVVVRRLSDAGEKYKMDVRGHLLKSYPEALSFFLPDLPYLLVIQVTFHERKSIHNISWMSEDPEKRAKSRYKKVDVSNRIKLFEDALADAVGLDDKHNFFIGAAKSWARDYEATEVWAFNREQERDNPVDALLQNLRQLATTQPH